MAYIYEVILSKHEIRTIIDAMLTHHAHKASLNTLLSGIYLTMTEHEEKSKTPQFAKLSIVHDKEIGR